MTKFTNDRLRELVALIPNDSRRIEANRLLNEERGKLIRILNELDDEAQVQGELSQSYAIDGYQNESSKHEYASDLLTSICLKFRE